MRTKTLYRRDGERIGISRFPNFHKSGSIAGMIKLYYGKNALLNFGAAGGFTMYQANPKFIITWLIRLLWKEEVKTIFKVGKKQ